MIGAATLIGLIMLWKRQDLGFALVLVWALFGIYSKRTSEIPLVESVITSCLVGMAVLAVGILVGLGRNLLKSR